MGRCLGSKYAHIHSMSSGIPDFACANYELCGNQCSLGFRHCCRSCPHSHSRGCRARRHLRDEAASCDRGPTLDQEVLSCSTPGCGRLLFAPHRHCCSTCVHGVHSHRCARRSAAISHLRGRTVASAEAEPGTASSAAPASFLALPRSTESESQNSALAEAAESVSNLATRAQQGEHEEQPRQQRQRSAQEGWLEELD